jgi:hypothetical protein
MSVEAHVAELRRKHQALSDKIETEQRSPASNDLDLAELKRQKLKIKDQIERYAAE